MAGLPPAGAPPPGHGPGGPNTYPQWGVNQAGNIIEAHNEAEKIADAKRGYLAWFGSLQAAQNDVANQKNPFANGSLGLSNPFAAVTSIVDAVAKIGGAITGFFQVLTDGSLWRSLGWAILGAVLVISGTWLWLRKADIIPDAAPVPVPIPL